MQLPLIADLLGHSDTNTTMIYIDPEVLDETDDQDALEAALKLAI
jgi:integrase